MLEIEIKFRAADFASLRARLAELGAEGEGTRTESDHYHNAPDRDFSATDEAFRLRRVGERNVLTYKGPKLGGVAKTRTEIEVALADGPDSAEACLRMLGGLGYRPTAVVRKTRETFSLARGGFAASVCLDDAEGVGRFAEVEIVASPERRADAERTLLALADDLGLVEREPRSYLRMLLEATERHPRG